MIRMIRSFGYCECWSGRANILTIDIHPSLAFLASMAFRGAETEQENLEVEESTRSANILGPQRFLSVSCTAARATIFASKSRPLNVLYRKQG
jgi:hypothetical protein